MMGVDDGCQMFSTYHGMFHLLDYLTSFLLRPVVSGAGAGNKVTFSDSWHIHVG